METQGGGRAALAALVLALCWLPNTEADLSRYEVERHDGTEWVTLTTTGLSVSITCDPLCVYRHPVAVDLAGNASPMPMLLWPPPLQGGCP